jgi:hypothetical protein
MGFSVGAARIRRGSTGSQSGGGIRTKGMGSSAFSNGSGRRCGGPQDGIQCGSRWDPWGVRMKGMGSVAFSNDPAGLAKVKGSI